MAKLDWDRESREARKRKHGALPVWADPGVISFDDDLKIRELLQPLVDIVDEFAGMSRTQQRQRGSEFSHRLRRQADQVRATGVFDDALSREVLAGRVDHLVDRLRKLESAAR